MAILTGEEIKRQIAVKNIHITPYNPSRVQPASIDLTLGHGVRTYYNIGKWLDSREYMQTRLLDLTSSGYVIRPGVLYLMHTEEIIHTEKYAPVLDGKSSIARLGVVIHLTAGYGDPGYNGQYTLEVTCIHPVKLYPGMAIAQMRFHELVGEVKSYKIKGHYVGADAQGAVASMAYRQFEEQFEEEQKSNEKSTSLDRRERG